MSILKNKPSEVNTDYSSIVAEWQDRVAQVICYWEDERGGLIREVSGSALLATIEHYGFVAITNKHIIIDEVYGTAGSCIVGLYSSGFLTPSTKSIGGNPFLIAPNNRDSAYIRLADDFLESKNDTIGYFDKATKTALKLCSSNTFSNLIIKRGDNLIVLGYPAIGTQKGITITEGIISGIEKDYYITSAKIDHGNSGGAAILVKDSCYIGIPTWASTGSVESLGRILRTDLISP